MPFPEGFYWGGAVNAAQAEGAYDVDGRGLANYDVMTAGSVDKPRYTTYLLPDGSIRMHAGFGRPDLPEGSRKAVIDGVYYPTHNAVNFYYRYKEDIKLFAEMGFNIYRLSISWSRIFPNGNEKEPNRKGLDFYRSVFLELKKYNIEPLVTISHFDDPIWLEEHMGGWSSREMIAMYDKFCKVLFEEYKGLVKYWITFNEINAMVAVADMMAGVKGSNYYQDTFQTLHYQMVASAHAVKQAHEIDPDYVVACMLCAVVSYPYTCDPKDVLLNQQKAMEGTYYIADTMCKGSYPYFAQSIWKKYGLHLDITKQDEEDLLAGKADMLTFSYYATGCNTTHEVEIATTGNFSWGVSNPYIKFTDWGWGMDPDGLTYYLRDMYSRYDLPLMVVENGLGAVDVLEEDKTVHDQYRIDYLREHIRAMEKAIDEGVNVIGYTTWGSIDIISATTGEMKKRYGFIYVDLDNEGNGDMSRYRKDSFYWYKKVIASNGRDLD